MQRTTALAAALFVLACASAQAASRFVIHGAGFGHGVGMSQYGADGYAQHGKDYRFILAHYYSGTSIGQAPAGQTVRVLLRTAGSVSFTGADSAGGRRLNPATTYHVVPSGLGNVALRTPAGRTIKTSAPPLRVTGPGPLVLLGTAANGLSDGRYRGALEFRPTPLGTVNAINALTLENYVRGVVGAESPPSWPPAALQAQAVAARTYAITTGGGNAGFDQFADTRSQMYRGVAVETPATDAAVSSTDGQVVTYQGRPVVTYFFSTSGGRTEDVENSFIGSKPEPWLRSVPDPYDGVSPRHRWGPIRLTLSQAERKLHGLVKGSFRGIDVTRRGVSPRIVYADVVGSGGRTRVTGPTLRARLGLFDTWATFAVITSSGKTVAPPSAPGSDAPPSDEQTGGVQPGGSSGGSGGADPSGGARAAAFGIAGGVSGRVAPVRVGARIELQLRGGGHWIPLAWTHVERGGRYVFADLRHGAYRVVWRGDSGPIVRL